MLPPTQLVFIALSLLYISKVHGDVILETRRTLLETASAFKAGSEGGLETLLDRGEDASSERKEHKAKGLTGIDLALKEKKKSHQEKSVKLDVTSIEEKGEETLNAQKSGKVDAMVKQAEAEKIAAKKTKKELKKANKTKNKMGKTTKNSNAMLTIHECGKLEEKIAYIVPTKEVSPEKSVAYLVSFDRMKYGSTGDLKFVFESQDALDRMLASLPNHLQEWKVTDANVHRLSVELKENAIILSDKEVDMLSRVYGATFNGGVGDSTRFQRACERLIGLSILVDTQPCDYKYAVLAPPEGRFLPRPTKAPGSEGVVEQLKKAVGLGKSEVVATKPNNAVVNLGERRAQEVPDVIDLKAAEGSDKQTNIPFLPLVKLFDNNVRSNQFWAHDCSDATESGAQAAVRRMEKNALIFSGSQVSSPRYQMVAAQTKGFGLFTLQGQLPVIEMRDKAVRFLLELFRASDAKPSVPPTTFRGLTRATLSQIPTSSAVDLSDVLLYQYYNLVRNNYVIKNATTVYPHFPSCVAGQATLLDAAGTFGSAERKGAFNAKIKPLLVPKAFVGGDDIGAFAAIVYDQAPLNAEFQSIY